MRYALLSDTTATCPRPAGHDEPWPHRVENGSPAARYAILESNGAGGHCEPHAVDYDRRSMSALALANGRAEWATVLATGRMPA